MNLPKSQGIEFLSPDRDADDFRNRCSNTASQSAGPRATASRNGARCFLHRWRLQRLRSTLRLRRRITPVRLRIPWDLLGCRSSERDTQVLFFLYFLRQGSGVEFAWPGNLFCAFLALSFIRFLGGHFSCSGRADFGPSFFETSFFRSRVCFLLFSLVVVR
jgi:hypothetical protein